ncbi:hem peroxidase [Arabidopsis suecica]|uniref:peroxidase n=1 Tax=Arabidopsis suecica TaxID=45249 RepID=A0A8T1XZ76_ARASU|nr:hem peroxidase [Arabidopsis suecica]
MMFSMAVWWGWNWRCTNVFREQKTCRDKVRFVKDIAAKVRRAHVAVKSGTHTVERGVMMIRWRAPSVGWVKLTTNGASCGNRGLAAAGGVIRDGDGLWLGGFALNIGICSAPLAKLWKLKKIMGQDRIPKDREACEMLKLSMLKKWRQLERPDSFDASDEYHSQELSMAIYQREENAAICAHYYDQSCPAAEKIILETVKNATLYDPKVPARSSPQNVLPRLLHQDSTQSNQAEKDGPPNISVRSFYVIEDAKRKLEKACPRTVSCADVIAIAARDVVTLSGARGLSVKDIVTLSGGHTLGFSHCSSFEARLQNFSKVHDIDPSMNYAFAQTLKKKCPRSSNRGKNAGTVLDSTSSVFDNVYFKQILSGKGVFGSDQVLLSDSRTKWIVETYAQDQKAFFREFAASMVKLGNFGVKETGQVRLNTRFVN